MEKIKALLKEKVVLKQAVYDNTLNSFNLLKKGLETTIESLKGENVSVQLEYDDKGIFEAEIVFGDDTLIFLMHTNIFTFEKEHILWKNSYVHEKPERAVCGMISIYNFLTDSFKFSRGDDLGYLICRLFINSENHFFAEGKRRLGFLYNDFGHAQLNKENVDKLLEAIMEYCIKFDMFAPPFEENGQISVNDVFEAKSQAIVATGKRLGFRFRQDKEVLNENSEVSKN